MMRKRTLAAMLVAAYFFLGGSCHTPPTDCFEARNFTGEDANGKPCTCTCYYSDESGGEECDKFCKDEDGKRTDDCNAFCA